MTMRVALTVLVDKLDELHEALNGLLWAVVQGQPQAQQDHSVVDHYEAITTDLIALSREAKYAAATESERAAGGEIDIVSSRHTVITCQERFNQLWTLFYAESFSFAWRDVRASVGQEGCEWATWAQGVDDAFSRCSSALYDVSQGLFSCWQDLVEWPSRITLAIHVSSAGHDVQVASGPPGPGEPTRGRAGTAAQRETLSL